MATTTNYGWETPDDTDLVKDGAAAIRTLGSSVDTTTKNLNPETTLGDLAYRSSTSNVNTRLAIGSAGQILTVASGVPSWATPASTAGSTLITRQSFSNQATYDIDNIFSSTYQTYAIVFEECFSTVDNSLLLQFRYAGPSTQILTYYSNFARFSSSAISGGTTVSNGDVWALSGSIRTSTDQASNGVIYVNQVGNGSRNPISYGNGFAGSQLQPTIFGGYQATARVYTGIRLFAGAGNLSANVSIYGMAK